MTDVVISFSDELERRYLAALDAIGEALARKDAQFEDEFLDRESLEPANQNEPA